MLGLVLLFAAPADAASAEIVDSYAASVADDVEVAAIEVGVLVPAFEPARVACDRADIVAPAPVLAGVFRPPRRAVR